MKGRKYFLFFLFYFFFFQAEDGIRDRLVTGVQTCALPILYKEVALMKKKPKSESLDNFKQHWNERLDELQKTCDFEYQILDVKQFLVK